MSVKSKHKKNQPIIDDDDELEDMDNFDDESDNDQVSDNVSSSIIKQVKKSKPSQEKEIKKLKEKILVWLDNDDQIKELNNTIKKHKEKKKICEDKILEMIDNLGMGDNKLDTDKGRVYKYKSVTRGALKEDIIKSALMETIRNEKQVDQLIKKIESKRPMTEKFYLKRTKGNN